MTSPMFQLVDKIVDGLPQFIASGRAEGKSFDLIARELSERTETYVSGETIRRWASEAAA